MVVVVEVAATVVEVALVVDDGGVVVAAVTVVVVSAAVAHPARSRRARLRKRLDVATADYEAKNETANGRPYNREVVANAVDRGCPCDAEDGRKRNPPDHTHEKCSEEVIGPCQEAGDETCQCTYTTDYEDDLKFHHGLRLSGEAEVARVF